MSVVFNPKALEEIALVAMHNDIVDNLEFAVKQPHYDGLSARTASWIESISYSSIISDNPYSCSVQDVVSIIRDHLSRTLVGIVNDDIRKKLLLCFNKDTTPPLTRHIEFMSNSQEFVQFLYAYLDCVLDESITELKVPNNLPVTFLHGSNNSNLFEIIAERSPFLSDIHLHFNASFISRRMLSSFPESATMFVTSLQQLRNLTSLSISHMYPEYRSFFRHVGSSFPALKSLTVVEFSITAEDILDVIGGQHHHVTLQREANRFAGHLHRFQLDPESVTPICATLQHLRLGGGNLVRDVAAPVIAFVLRHMPNLKTCVINPESSRGPILAVELLHHTSNPSNSIDLDLFNGDPLTILTKEALYSGRLSLTELDYVPVDDESKLEAVRLLCPLLEKVTFCQSTTLSATSTAAINDNPISSHQLQAVLKYWPSNLNKVSFNDVSSDYRQVILDRFCNDLMELSYESVYNINPLELSSCTKLKSLEMLERTSLMSHATSKGDDQDDFLPRLKKLKTNVCLGSMSRLFQAKSSYTFLDIACCHVASEESEWMQIDQIWPHVQTLRIRRSKGLNRTLAQKVFSKFGKLKELALSESMVGGDINLKEKLMADKVINLLFLQSQGYMYCPLFGEKSDWSFHGY